MKKLSLEILRWTLSIGCFYGAAQFAFSQSAIAEAHHFGLPDIIRLTLAWAEMIAAILFLVPKTIAIGGKTLLATIFAAMILHILHGQWQIGDLVILAAATFAVITNRI